MSPRPSTRSTRRSWPGSSRPRAGRRARSARRRCRRRAGARPSTARARSAAPGAGRRPRRQARPARSISPSRPVVVRGDHALLVGQPRRRGRLGQDLGIVEVEAAAEREPRGREHVRRAAPALGRAGRRRASRRTRRRGTAPARPAGAAAPRRAPRPCAGRPPRGRGAARGAVAGVQTTSSNARSIRSAARYENGHARSKKNCACVRSGRLPERSRRASLRAARSMSSPMVPICLFSDRAPATWPCAQRNDAGRRNLHCPCRARMNVHGGVRTPWRKQITRPTVTPSGGLFSPLPLKPPDPRRFHHPPRPPAQAPPIRPVVT